MCQVINIADLAEVDPADFAEFQMSSGTRSYLKRCIREASVLTNAERKDRELKLDAANAAKRTEEESAKVFLCTRPPGARFVAFVFPSCQADAVMGRLRTRLSKATIGNFRPSCLPDTVATDELCKLAKEGHRKKIARPFPYMVCRVVCMIALPLFLCACVRVQDVLRFIPPWASRHQPKAMTNASDSTKELIACFKEANGRYPPEATQKDIPSLDVWVAAFYRYALVAAGVPCDGEDGAAIWDFSAAMAHMDVVLKLYASNKTRQHPAALAFVYDRTARKQWSERSMSAEAGFDIDKESCVLNTEYYQLALQECERCFWPHSTSSAPVDWNSFAFQVRQPSARRQRPAPVQGQGQRQGQRCERWDLRISLGRVLCSSCIR